VCHIPNKNHRVSLVALMTSCVARADERLRVFSHCLPKRGEKCGLPACTRLGQDPTGTKFRSSCRSPPRGYPRSIHPHYLSVYASTSHFDDVASITASRRLIDSLQHSIRSLWLRATPAGITPACHQTISSPHVHFIVIWLFRFQIRSWLARYRQRQLFAQLESCWDRTVVVDVDSQDSAAFSR